jgi:hypothetical protein
MKRTRKRLPIPQHGFGFVPDMFNLFQEARLTANALRANATRRIAQGAPPRKPKPPFLPRGAAYTP